MANMKKVDKSEMLLRIEALEKAVDEINKRTAVPEAAPIPVPTVLTDKALVPVPLPTPPGVERKKCQTNTCSSMDTKEYSSRGAKLWLCESHKV